MRRVALAIAVLAVAALPAVASGSGAAIKHLEASLKGSSEVPGPGAPSGKGRVELSLNTKTGRICWEFKGLKNLGGKAMSAHIHKGRASVAGAVLVPLGAAYRREGCTASTAAVVRSILAHPRRFYVNVHNAAYPNGAIRGQLTAG
jgi:hypothetical protein